MASRGGRDARSQVHAVLHGHPVQAELKVSRPEDPLEREAERVAEEVTREGATPTLRSPPPISRLPPAANDAGDASAEPNLSARLEGLAGRGRPLPAPLRLEMEQRFGHDFRGVRIHTGGEAAELADRFRARAFTWRHHVVFGAGAWQPETPTGRRLLAHELTHVVQQQAAGPVTPIQRRYDTESSGLVDAITELVDAAGNFVAEQGWKLVRRHAPGLEPILRQGPFNWLKQKVAGAFRSLTAVFDRLNPLPHLQGLLDTFNSLLDRAGRIVRALLEGDCRPLFAALRELRQFVTEVAGRAWEKLVDFLRPVGEFFTNLWNGFGAPAVEWLRRFAGDLWSDLEQLGRDIWAWLRPLRETIAAAWNWVRDKLFGSDERSGEGDSEGGILGWIRRKAGEVWDWIKASTRPIWEPVRDAAAWIAELLPPAFVREMGESMQSLGQELQRTGDNLREGDGVAENRQTLAEVLPSIDQVLQFVRRLLVSAGQWLGTKVGALGNGVRRILRWLRSSSLLAFLAGLLDWLGSAATDLENWARNTVAGIFNWLAQGFDALTPFLRQVLATVRRLITVVTDLLQLPLLVAQALWRRIPACIRDPIEDFLINQILRRIPVFGQMLAVPELWEKLKADALRILRQVFVDGNLRKAAQTFFSTLLRVVGLPVELVVSVLAKAMTVFGDILRNPVAFLRNVFGALVAGFRGFFERFGTHMLAGIRGWLFRQVQEAGIEPPADFSPASIFGFVLRILDITVERILARLAKRIGEQRMARLRRLIDRATGVWTWVKTLITEGPAALWRELKARLVGLWDTVVQGVVDWIQTRIIMRVSAKLLASLASGGILAIVQAIVAIYDVVRTVAQYLRDILEMMSRVLDGIGEIVAGRVARAGLFLENALAASLPVAIGFLANLVGLGGLGRRVRNMIGRVRARVDQAIDWLINRAIQAGRALLRMLRRGARAVRQWWRAEKRFRTADGNIHRIYVERRGRQARLMMASQPKPYVQYLEKLQKNENGDDKCRDHSSARKGKESGSGAGKWDELYEEAKKTAEKLDKHIDKLAKSEDSRSKNKKGSQGMDAETEELDRLLSQLQNLTQALYSGDANAGCNACSTIPKYRWRSNGFGSSVEIERLTGKAADGQPIREKGSKPEGSARNDDWDYLILRRGGTYYIRGHLWSEKLGGPGKLHNLTPLTRSANARHETRFESRIKDHVAVEGRLVKNFRVKADYDDRSDRANVADKLERSGDPDENLVAKIIRAERHVPTKLEVYSDLKESCAQYASSDNVEILNETIENTDALGRKVDDVDPLTEEGLSEYLGTQPKRRIVLSDASPSELASFFGISKQESERLGSREKPFTRWRQVYEEMPDVWKNKGFDSWKTLRDSMTRKAGWRVFLWRMRN